jgi:hypothetical protein
MKESFIEKYNTIHENLKFLEGEISSCINNKEALLKSPEKLEDLKRRIFLEIEILKKTREDERKKYNY